MAEADKNKRDFSDIVERLAELNKNQDRNIGEIIELSQLTKKRNQMAAEASGLSKKEAGRRADFDAEMKALEEKRDKDKEIAGEDAPSVLAQSKIIEKKRYKEGLRREAMNLASLENIGNKLDDLRKSFFEKTKDAGTTFLKGIGALALFAFLSTDTFKTAVRNIVTFITDFIAMFTGEKTSLDFIKDNWKALGVLLLLFSGKVMSIAALVSGSVTTLGKMLPSWANISRGFRLMRVYAKRTMLPAIKGMLVGMKGFMASMLPILSPVALIAGIAYGVVRIFQGFQKHFSEANEQFGFLGGIVAGVVGGIKQIVLDVANVIDSILGFFGFPDAMDGVIKAIEEFDVMDFVSGVWDFFGDIKDAISNFISSLIPDWIKKWIPGTDAYNKRKGITNENALTQQNMLENRVAGVYDVKGTDLEDLKAKQSELEREKIAQNVVNVTNLTQGGARVTQTLGSNVYVQDLDSNPYQYQT
jgi:hypothetical protein